MKELILYLLTFIITYLVYFVFVLRRKSVLEKFPEGKEMKYLKIKYGVKINEKNLKSIANKVCLANSFIIATTVYVVCLFKSLFVEIIVGLATILILIFILYYIIGTYYRKKQGGKNV